MKSEFSDEVSGQVGPAEQPMAPVIVSKTIVGNKATLVVQLPAISVDGQPLASLAALHVYADPQSFLGRLETLVGMEPQATMNLVEVPAVVVGAQVAIDIPNLAWGTKYYFTACVE